jgi:hypothetical protein
MTFWYNIKSFKIVMRVSPHDVKAGTKANGFAVGLDQAGS